MTAHLSRRELLAATALPALSSLSLGSLAQRAGTTRIIVPTAAGSALDLAQRTLQPALNQALSSNVYIENLAGASTTIGTSAAVRAAPDGTTLCVNSNNLLISALVFNYVRYHPLEDITPISLLGTSPLVVVSNPSFAPKSIQELMAVLVANPGKYNYASPGPGTVNEMATALLLLQTGVKMQAVSYGGTGPAMTAIISGECQLGVMALPSAASQIAAGKLKALGMCGSARPDTHPDIPLVSEQGYPNYRFDGWHLLFGPKGMSPALVQKLHSAFRDVARAPEMNSTLAKQANYYDPLPPAETTAFLQKEMARYEQVVRDANLRIKS